MIKVGLDHTLFIQIIQFLVVVFLTNKFIIKPIKGTIDTRDAKINGLISSAEESLKSVEESRLSYEGKMMDIRNEISEYQRKVDNETSVKVGVAVAKAKEEIEVTTANSRAELEKAMAETREAIRKDVKELGELIYKAISGKAA